MITLLNLRTDDSSISIITAPSFKKNIYFDVKMESNLNLLYQHLKEFLDDWMIKSVRVCLKNHKNILYIIKVINKFP